MTVEPAAGFALPPFYQPIVIIITVIAAAEGLKLFEGCVSSFLHYVLDLLDEVSFNLLVKIMFFGIVSYPARQLPHVALQVV